MIYRMKAIKKNKDLHPWTPLDNSAEIGVNIKNGILTITGFSDFYPRKALSVDAESDILIIKAVLNKVENKFKNSWASTNDNALAHEVIDSFQKNWRIPQNKIKVQFD